MNLNEFDLQVVKIKENSVYVEYTSPNKLHKEDVDILPHPDLIKEVGKLTPILNKVFENNRMKATGISVKKLNEDRLVTITGVITFASGKKKGISSEGFQASGYYDFEDKLFEVTDNIILETYAFLFDEKTGDKQGKLFDPADKPKDKKSKGKAAAIKEEDDPI
ncbi:hypothetical protein A2Z67_02550 [Candidatus Woesebacteria bacterium RBG_13_36_22]|uniref:Uncharacterized protein n=1 Tax=Candidatus Woesebacteria bacterium RBG_13_36_22 TaxID=1802478 RepID=A0A1F7X3I1_9BACT|nr:MAG: hypothetical protein A2Z67_02550 [Candidatus Woesebacteria bacterium RBG_13_36_22]